MPATLPSRAKKGDRSAGADGRRRTQCAGEDVRHRCAVGARDERWQEKSTENGAARVGVGENGTAALVEGAI